MSSRRLKARVPSAKVFGVGVLKDHCLAFHKISTIDGSGKCDIIQSSSDEVVGVLFEIDEHEKGNLDRYEGLNRGYAEKSMEITCRSGESISAFMYYATHKDQTLKPFSWYLRHILEGAKEADLPGDYIMQLEKVETIKDPDRDRELEELAMYS